MFKDRTEAALRLCEALRNRSLENALVIGILRGGGYMAKVIGKCLGIPWGVLPIKKISPPESPESGFGAVVYDGTNVYDLEYARILGIDEDDISRILKIKLLEAKEQYEKYKDFVVEEIEGKNVFLVDDGIATGYTTIAGAKFIRDRNPKSLCLVVPVASENAYELVKEYFDEVLCLNVVKSVFFAVGMFYENFEQISDNRIIGFFRENPTI